MLHLISRRAWKQTQLGTGQGAAAPPAPAPAMARKRKRSPSPQETEPVPAVPAKREKRGRPSTSKIVKKTEELPEEKEVEQTEEVAARPSRNRRKSSKVRENEEDSASTTSERETEPPQVVASKTNRRKSGKAEKSKEVESEERRKEEEGGTHMTIITGKGKKAKTTNIHIKPIKDPRREEVETAVTSHVREEGRSSKSKRKSGKRSSEMKPLSPLEIPSDSNITTVREETGIKLKLIISPKDRVPPATSSNSSLPDEPMVEEKKSKKDKGRKSKGKEKKDDVKQDTKLKAKLVFGDQILSLYGDKVTHSEKPKESSSSSQSKKRKRAADEEEVDLPPMVATDKSSKKRNKGKVHELEVKEEVIDSPVVISKSDKKGKKHKKESKESTPLPEESPAMIEREKTDSRLNKSKSHKDKDKHRSKDKHKEEIKLEFEASMSSSKDKKIKKKKSRHDKIKFEIPMTPSGSDLDLSHVSPDSFEDTDVSLVIDETFSSPSKGHISSKKKKSKKERTGDNINESSKEREGESSKDVLKENVEKLQDSSEGDVNKDAELRKDHHRSKHKHDKHRHGKHRSSSDKKSKHKKHRSMDEYKHFSDHSVPTDFMVPFSSPESSMNDLSTINASALGFVSSNITYDSPGGIMMSKKTPSNPSKSKKKPKKEQERSSSKHPEVKQKEKVRMVRDKDGNLVPKPKKPLSAYMLWCKNTRPSVVAENPHADFSAISKLMGIKWHQLTDKDKAKWQGMHRKLKIKHKNIPTLSANKLTSRRSSGHSGKGRSPSKLHPPNMEAIDIAAHLRLLGESLSTVGRRLKEHQGEIEIHGSVSVLLDSTLCALGPLLALTSQVPELNGCSRDTHVSTLENIAYIMPGL